MKQARPLTKRYCEMCDKWVAVRAKECPDCGAPTQRALRQSPAARELGCADAVPTRADGGAINKPGDYRALTYQDGDALSCEDAARRFDASLRGPNLRAYVQHKHPCDVIVCLACGSTEAVHEKDCHGEPMWTSGEGCRPICGTFTPKPCTCGLDALIAESSAPRTYYVRELHADPCDTADFCHGATLVTVDDETPEETR